MPYTTAVSYTHLDVYKRQGKDCTEKQLKQLSETALRQINENKYDIDLKAAGIDHIYKYGVAFCGKNVEIAVEL